LSVQHGLSVFNAVLPYIGTVVFLVGTGVKTRMHMGCILGQCEFGLSSHKQKHNQTALLEGVSITGNNKIIPRELTPEQ